MIDTTAAEAYDAELVPVVFRPWAELMVQEARVHNGMRTLDVACGTGVVARCAARLCSPEGRSSSGVIADCSTRSVHRHDALHSSCDPREWRNC